MKFGTNDFMKKNKLVGQIEIPGDKSVSHRALIFSAFSKGSSEISNLSPAEDCGSTMDCLSRLGLKFYKNGCSVKVESQGIDKLSIPKDILFAGNSGTTLRLLSGLVAGQSMTIQFDGDESLRKRPMARVLDHLTHMGAKITYANGEGKAPFAIEGGDLKGAEFDLSVPSAQVQTAILLAGLQAEGSTTVTLPSAVRDHTERMFKYMEIPLKTNGNYSITVEKLSAPVKSFSYSVMGDISSAAFFLVAAACLPGSDLTLTNIGINEGRALVVDVLKKMGANIELFNNRESGGEPIVDIRVKGEGRLQGTSVSGTDIARGIDEIPVLALAGSLCQGDFLVSNAQELRHKESDRLQLITANLKAAGAEIAESQDGFVIAGKKSLPGGSFWQTAFDHRLAMAGLVANLLCDQPLTIEEIGSAAISYPGFVNDLQSVIVS
jgi:3-phosphoshikimate 1-carboxyvinyltransferase